MEACVVFAVAMMAIQPSTSQQVTDASIRQMKLDEIADEWQKRTFTDQQRNIAGNAALILKAAHERKLEFRWTFP